MMLTRDDIVSSRNKKETITFHMGLMLTMVAQCQCRYSETAAVDINYSMLTFDYIL